MSLADKLTTVAENMERVYEAGKTAEWNAFWDIYQVSGTRTDYEYAFYNKVWTDENFKPKYDIKPVYGLYLFRASAITDLKGILEECGVVLDLSSLNSASASHLFRLSAVTRLPEINLTTPTTLSYTFRDATKLVSIDKLILKADGSQAFTETFNGCSSLEEIAIEGAIGNDISFSSCTKLTKDSITSIINALSADAEGKTLSLSLAAVNNAFETDSDSADGSTSSEWQELTGTKTNWTISLI